MMGEKSLGQGGLATLTRPHNRHDRIAFRGFQNVFGTFSGNHVMILFSERQELYHISKNRANGKADFAICTVFTENIEG